MKSGTYWEYLCIHCGWFPQLKVSNGNSDQVKERLEDMIKEHIKKGCNKSYNDGKEDMQRKYEII